MSDVDRTRAINALIAEHVFGMWLSADRLYADHAPLRAYSEDIGVAWTVVERLNAKLITVEITALVSVRTKAVRYIVYSYNHETAMPREQAIEDSAPLAICLVALKSVGITVPD